MSTDAEIVNVRIKNSNDKGISVGQGSTVNVERNLIIGCDSGIAIKDNAAAFISNNTFFYNDTSISCFEKNEGEGGGIAEVINNIFSYNISASLLLLFRFGFFRKLIVSFSIIGNV